MCSTVMSVSYIQTAIQQLLPLLEALRLLSITAAAGSDVQMRM